MIETRMEAPGRRNGHRNGDGASLSDRVPPQNLDMERSVIAAIALDNTQFDAVLQLVQPEDFYAESHREMYKAMLRLRGAGIPVDPVTLAEAIGDDLLREIGGVAYLTEVLETLPHAAHAEFYAKTVREKSIRRRLIYAATEALQLAYNGAGLPNDEILAKHETNILSLIEAEAGVRRSRDFADVLADTLDRINARATGKRSDLSSGYAALDAVVTGFQRTDLVILAARPSIGKTAMALGMARKLTAGGHAVSIFSLEQPDTALAERLVAMETAIDSQRLRRGNVGDVDQRAMCEAANRMSSQGYLMHDTSSMTVSQIAALARADKRKHGTSLVIVDYLQLIDSEDKRINREQQVATISRRLKQLARDIEVPVLCLAQLSRELEKRPDRRPRLSDLRESGSIEADADIVLLLHRPEFYDKNDRPGEADVIVAKNRGGPTDTAKLLYQSELTLFCDDDFCESQGELFQ